MTKPLTNLQIENLPARGIAYIRQGNFIARTDGKTLTITYITQALTKIFTQEIILPVFDANMPEGGRCGFASLHELVMALATLHPKWLVNNTKPGGDI